ncbi:HNH endonuclease [Desulfofustis limnaeus]|nr:HNH endonuclease signature motif containing protein [Desulfofustis limnaeus]
MNDSITRQLLIEMQDFLAPKLDSYEQMLYHYLFRHSHLEGLSSTIIGIRTIQTRAGLGVGQAGSPPSQMVVMKKLRSLEDKGCIKIVSRSSRGTEIRVLLPKDIPGVVPAAQTLPKIDLEELDFFSSPALRLQILKRDKYKCFYCFRNLSEASYTVDHIRPQAEGGRHSYRNVVACCFECNVRKQNRDGKAFLLQNYREGMLTAEEYQERLLALESVQAGGIKPDLTNVV